MNVRNLCILLATVCILGTSSVHGYATGAAPTACGTMVPGHYGASTQTSPSPVTMSMNASSFDCGHTIKVTLSSSARFKGFLCQSRADPAMSATTGMIEPGMYHTTCTTEKGTITHKNNTLKTSVMFDWMPMGTPVNFKFVCTVVVNYSTFWVKMQSPMVTFTGTSSTCDATNGGGTTAKPDDTTTKANDNTNDGNNSASDTAPTFVSFSLALLLLRLIC